MRKKIYYHDTDCGGVVYYANYLKCFEEARTEYMRSCGIDTKDLADKGILFVVRRVQIQYKSPAKYGQEVDIVTKLSEVKKLKLNFYQYIKRDQTVIVKAHTQLGCINNNFKPEPIPKEALILLQNALSNN